MQINIESNSVQFINEVCRLRLWLGITCHSEDILFNETLKQGRDDNYLDETLVSYQYTSTLDYTTVAECEKVRL